MNKRIKEITNSIGSFSQDLYHKSEVLPELFKLQDEIVNLTFNKDHADNGRLRLWDVKAYIEQLNAECGYVVDEQLQRFKDDCKTICNIIKAEKAGQAGEHKAFRSLETVRCRNMVLKNVEFTLNDHRTEVDAIVITENTVFIIEVKNPIKNIQIDERGNYYRESNEKLIFDKNIGEQMNDKEYLLREVFKTKGLEGVNIQSLVVFTNSLISVQNNYPYIRTCYLSELPHIINRSTGESYFEDIMDMMVIAINESMCYEKYPMPIDMKEFKMNFAVMMAILENAKKGIPNEGGLEVDRSDESVSEFAYDVEPIIVHNWRQRIAMWFMNHRSMIPVVAAIDMIPIRTVLKNGHAVDRDTIFN